jgi:ribonuclease HII
VLFDLDRLTLSARRSLSRLNDSKQHTEAGREELYPLVMSAAARASIVVRCPRGIDARGLHVTNLEALRSALQCVACEEALCLIDGFRVRDLGFEQRAVIGGDSRSAAIAAASVLAKVTRDRMMREEAPHFPGYDFDLNKGYPCPRHKMALKAWGPTSIHRRTWVFMDHLPWSMPKPPEPEQTALPL